MNDTLTEMKHNFYFLKPSLLIILFAFIIFAVFIVLTPSDDGRIGRSSVMLCLYLVVALFKADAQKETPSPSPKTILGRYCFVLLAYLAAFAALLICTRGAAMLFDTVLPPLPSLPVFSLSFLFFAFIVGLELTTCYTNGVEAGLSPSILFVLIAVIVFIFPIINAWSKIIIAISTANGFYLSLAAIISGSIFLWLSYRYSVKSVNQHH